jgi:hypothetical protein
LDDLLNGRTRALYAMAGSPGAVVVVVTRLNDHVGRKWAKKLLGSEDTSRYRRVEGIYERVKTRRIGTRSCSQFGEDRLLRVLFPENSGVYVDVGAGGPAVDSNTYLFYCSGWSGFLIDPVARYERWARAVRPRDRFKLAVCSSSGEEHLFYEFTQAQFSTLDGARAEQLVAAGRTLARTYRVPSVAIADLPVTCEPRDPCFFSIDVEGAEMTVLESIDWGRTTPAVICVEELVLSLDEQSEVGRHLSNRGYRLEGRIGLSSIYVHAESGRSVRVL